VKRRVSQNHSAAPLALGIPTLSFPTASAVG